ncbi:MAG: YebC/PmpR family DNA-binding transcriptional regulator, partial [bacterium]
QVDGEFQIITGVDEFTRVKKTIEEAGIEIENAEVTQIPQTTVPVDEKDSKKVLDLLETLDDHDDVQQVYSNFEMDEQAAKRAEAMST